jgi:hypothetical protein
VIVLKQYVEFELKIMNMFGAHVFSNPTSSQPLCLSVWFITNTWMTNQNMNQHMNDKPKYESTHEWQTKIWINTWMTNQNMIDQCINDKSTHEWQMSMWITKQYETKC